MDQVRFDAVGRQGLMSVSFRFYSNSSESDRNSGDHHQWYHVYHCHLPIPVSWFPVRFIRVKIVHYKKIVDVFLWTNAITCALLNRLRRAGYASVLLSRSVDEEQCTTPSVLSKDGRSSFIQSNACRSASTTVRRAFEWINCLQNTLLCWSSAKNNRWEDQTSRLDCLVNGRISLV